MADSIHFVLPASFEPAEFLPARPSSGREAGCWLVNILTKKSASESVDHNGYARLDSRILQRMMSKRNHPQVTNALIGGGVIDRDESYRTGAYCKGYRLSDCYLRDQVKFVYVMDSQLIRRINEENLRWQQVQEARCLPIHYILAEQQQDLRIDARAIDAVAELEEFARLSQDLVVHRLLKGQLPFSVSITGRVFNGISNLKRELRQHVRLAGKPILGVDICCAQPALFVILMSPGPAREAFLLAADIWCRRISRSGVELAQTLNTLAEAVALLSRPSPVVGHDFGHFEDLVLQGCLYERLIELCEAAGLGVDEASAREDVKKLLVRDVLAKKGQYPSAFEDLFRAAFPSVHRVIRWINSGHGGHARLICLLQRFESWLVIENVAPRLINEIPIVTLHDAIYSEPGNTSCVVDAFEETFSDLGMKLRVSAE